MTEESTPQDAVVTREHRTAVIVAENGHGLASPLQFDWIQNGGDDVLDRYAQALANEFARGQRSRDAELERVTRELAELRATGVTDERLASDALRLRDVLQTAVLPLGRTRAELVGMLDRIAALAARGGR